MMKKLLFSCLITMLCGVGGKIWAAEIQTSSINVRNTIEPAAVELYQGANDWFEFDLSSITISNLGNSMTWATLADNFADYRFCALNSNTSTLTTESTAYDGWWLQPNNLTTHTGESSSHAWGSGDNRWYCEYLSLSADTKKLTAHIGVEATANVGDQLFFYLYLINTQSQQNKKPAIRVKITLNVVARPEVPTTYTEVGHYDATAELKAMCSFWDDASNITSAEFDVSAVNIALGIDNISDAELFIVNADGTLVKNDNVIDGWRDAEGNAGAYGDENGLCVKLSDPTTGSLDWIGSTVSTHQVGTTHTSRWGFYYEGKLYIINVVVSFVSPLETPETTLSELIIVGSKEITVDMYPRPNWNGDELSIDVSDAAAVLETNSTDLEIGFTSSFFAKAANEDCSGVLTTLQSINNKTSNYGWYFHKIGETNEAAVAAYQVSETDFSDYYLESFSYDGSSLNFIIGQQANKLTVGQSFYNYLYIIVGTNAYQIKVNLNVVEPKLSDMTESGTKSITIGQVLSQQAFSTYDMTTDTPTLAEIATALGCAEGELRLYALDADGNLSSNTTANNGGYWMNKDGRICGWATENCGLFVEPVSASDLSTLTIGQFDNAYTEPATWTTSLYIVNTSGKNYYTLSLTVNLTMGDISLSETDKELPDINGQRGKVELSRTFFEGWNTLVLPFDINMGELLSSTGLQVVEIGTFAYDELTDETYHIHFTKQPNDMTLMANIPYLINFNGNFDGDITVNNAKINIGEPIAEGTNFDFVGTYVQGELIGANDYYVGKENSFWKSTRARTTKGFRAFLKAKSEGAAPARITFDFGNGEATAIQTLDGEDVNVEQGEWYTLAGQCIAAPAHRGLYIKNGKKYFVK